MMTVVTTMRVNAEAEGEWDKLIEQRFRSAHSRDGWISGQLLRPVDSPHTRVIVGTWHSRDDWQAWHQDPAFLATRGPLDQLQTDEQSTTWYEVVEDARAATR